MAKNNTFCIIGLNTFGESLANQLTELGCPVMVIDSNEEKINKVNNKYNKAVQADATNIAALRALGVQDLDTVIVSIPEFETSVYVCTNLKDLHIPNIIVYAKSNIQIKILRNIGVNTVITPELHSAKSLSLQLSSEIDVQDTFVGDGYSLIKLFVNKFEDGINLQDVYEKFEYIDIFSIRRGNRTLLANTINKIEMGDILFIICDSNSINKVISFFYRNLEDSN